MMMKLSQQQVLLAVLATALLPETESFQTSHQQHHQTTLAKSTLDNPTKPLPPTLYYANDDDEGSQANSVVTPPPIVFMNGTSLVIEMLAHDPQNTDENANSSNPVQPTHISGKIDPKQTDPEKKPKQQRKKRASWNERYHQLQQFYQTHGHSLVPQNHPPNPPLGLWVMAQRRQHTLKQQGKPHSLTTERMELLQQLDFVFRVDRRGPRGAYGNIRRWKNKQPSSTSLSPATSATVPKSWKVPSVPTVPTMPTKPREPRNTLEEIDFVEDFENYMIQKKDSWTDNQMNQAWKRRFRVFHDTSVL